MAVRYRLFGGIGTALAAAALFQDVFRAKFMTNGYNKINFRMIIGIGRYLYICIIFLYIIIIVIIQLYIDYI